MKKVITVLGEVSPNDLGIVMPHEHVACDIRRESGRIDNLLDDVEVSCREVSLYWEAGGGNISAPYQIEITDVNGSTVSFTLQMASGDIDTGVQFPTCQ